ncbi:MAG TPA: hypothetical protein VF011_02780 [Terriglobales bacterium]
MARGLSDLQKWMLIRALENAESELCKTEWVEGDGITAGFSCHPVHLDRNEVRADYYHFPVYVPEWCINKGKTREYLRTFGRHFVKRDIPNYAVVNLAISRAHDRLRRRGLVTNQVGFWLTEKGREVARLLATPCVNVSRGAANKDNGYPKDRATVGTANKDNGYPNRQLAAGAANNG